MSGEFSHYPDNQPMPKGAELQAGTIDKFVSEVERLAKPKYYHDVDGESSGQTGYQWYWDVITNSLILVSREHQAEGRWKHNECTVTMYEEPERQGKNDLAQISRSFRLNIDRPETSTAEVDLTSYSQDSHRETYDPSNIEGLPNPTDAELNFLERMRARSRRDLRAQEQRQDGVHISQLPPVGTVDAEFVDILKVLARLEQSDEIEEGLIHTRPYRLVPEEG